MSKIKLSTAQAKALRDAEIIGNMYVIKAHAATVKALRNLGMVERETFCLTVAGAVARTGLEGMDLSRGTSVYPYDLGDAEELFTIPSVSDVPSDVRADWERELESNAVPQVVIDEPYWASNGPILAQLDSVPSECYYACGKPVVAVWFDSVGNVEGACATHLVEITNNGYHSTMLPKCEHAHVSMGVCEDCGAARAQLPPIAPVDVLAASIAHMREPYIGVRQGRKGFTAPEHIHAPGCGDIAKELKRFRGDTFDYAASMTLADIVAANWADVASDEYGDDVMTSAEAWRDMVEWMRDASSGVKIMACAKGMIGGECPAGEIFRASDGFPRIKPRTGVVDCAECGEHIMSDDMSIPATCEGGCTVENVNGPWIDPTCGCERWADPSVVPCPDHTRACESCGASRPITGECGHCGDTMGATHTDDDMADTMDAPVTVEAHLMITVSEGVTVDLGWHTFTVPVGCEKTIPTLYGERNGEWRTGTANWDSIIRVVESYTE